jgi:hypothetical protein
VTGSGDHRVVFGRVLNKRDLADAVSEGKLLFTLHSTTCSARRPVNPKPPGVQIDRPRTTPADRKDPS